MAAPCGPCLSWSWHTHTRPAPPLPLQAYDILKTLGGLTNEELTKTFTEWNQQELKSFLVEITSIIMGKQDDQGAGFLVDKIVDQTGSKGTGEASG